MVTVGKPFVVVFGIGTGNSPPARKRAASPDSVVKFGSASRRANPFVSNAVISMSTEPPLLVRMRLVSKHAHGAGASVGRRALPRSGWRSRCSPAGGTSGCCPSREGSRAAGGTCARVRHARCRSAGPLPRSGPAGRNDQRDPVLLLDEADRDDVG